MIFRSNLNTRAATISDTLHSILVTAVECFQLADATYRAAGKFGVAMKTRNVVARDRMTTGRGRSLAAAELAGRPRRSVHADREAEVGLE